MTNKPFKDMGRNEARECMTRLSNYGLLMTMQTCLQTGMGTSHWRYRMLFAEVLRRMDKKEFVQ